MALISSPLRIIFRFVLWPIYIALRVIIVLAVPVITAWAVICTYLTYGPVRANFETAATTFFHRPVHINGPVLLVISYGNPGISGYRVTVGVRGQSPFITAEKVSAALPFGVFSGNFDEPAIIVLRRVFIDGAPFGSYNMPLRIFANGIEMPGIQGRLGKTALDANFKYGKNSLHLDAKLRNLDYGRLAAGSAGPTVRADIDLDAKGGDDSDVLGALNGHVTLVGGEGSIKSGAFGLWTSGPMSTLLRGGETPVHCSVADFAVKDGVAKAKAVEIDTDAAVITGAGSVDLPAWRMKMRFVPQPRPGLSLDAPPPPLTVSGPLDHLQAVPDDAGVVGHVGGALLGIVGAPLDLLQAQPIPLPLPGVGHKDAAGQDKSACRAYLDGGT
jgi:hypothetical protein